MIVGFRRSKIPRSLALLPYTNPLLTVSSLITQNTKQWYQQAMNDLIEQQDHHLIHKIFLSPVSHSDFTIWPYTKDGNFMVKSGYYYSVNQASDTAESMVIRH